MKFPRSSFLRSRRRIATIAALLLILFLFRPGIYQLRNRIAGSIGNALGRRVELDNVRLRLLPRPGFDLEGLVIYDDPAFSAEPMIRADAVSAAIRIRSLFRGRLEIATLSANEPSINLVRNDQGRWNLASLIERNARIPAAPTKKSASESRPAFPYLEAGHARVNFKIGQTKKSYALMDGDVALWQDSENSWGARIKAEPVRTDFHLTDTGLVQINAEWQRAPSLRLTPVQFTVEWQNGQLGQITKLLSGKDRGWRGGVNLTAQISGTPEALRIASRIGVEDFHRYDIVDRENVRLGANCSAQYDAVASKFDDLLCESPVGDGTLRLHGSASLKAQLPAYDLTLDAVNVPLTSVVRLLQHAKQQLPRDLTAGGLLNAQFHAKRSVPRASGDGPSPYSLLAWTGSGSATNVVLSSNAGADAVSFGTVPLAVLSQSKVPDQSTPANMQASLLRTRRRPVPLRDPEVSDIHLQIGPTALAMNGASPANASGWISPRGYLFSLRGDADLQELFRLERVLGLPVTRPAAEGSARLDASVSGLWQGFAPPTVVGAAQLHNVHAESRGLNTPIEISSAVMTLTPDTMLLQKLSARTGSTHWSGAVTAPRHCALPNATAATVPGTVPGNARSRAAGSDPGKAPNCVFQFDLTADQLSTTDLADWFIPHPVKRPWYRILSSNLPSGRSPLLAIQAHGSLHVGRLVFKKLMVTQLATQMEVDQGKITLNALRAHLLQGTHQGNWTLDLSPPDLPTSALSTSALSADAMSTNGPQTRDPSTHAASDNEAKVASVRYRGSGTLNDISLAQVSKFMNDDWISGTVDGRFDLNGSGDSFRGLVERSDGKFEFVMRNGSLTHIEIPGSPASLPVHRFAGDLQLKKAVWELSGGRLESRDGLYQVSGTASPTSGLDFILMRGDEQSWTISGTLAQPQVAAGSRTVAKHAAANLQP